MFGFKCPCSSGNSYKNCCEPYLKGEKKPPTALAVMRARYTAFAKHNIDYIKNSLHPKARKDFDRETVEKWATGSEWLGLEILSSKEGEDGDQKGFVEFIATFKSDGEEKKHHELAEFRFTDNKWYFFNGKVKGQAPVRNVAKVGRNDPCPCGSGKKYKKCCGK